MGKNRKTLAIIPARFQSSRFPGKLLAKLKQKPVLHWVCDSCNSVDLVDEVVVATDHADIKSAVEAWGYTARMTSDEHVSGTDRIGEVAADFPDFELVVNVQGDEPLLHPGHVDFLIDIMHQNPALDIATLMVPIASLEELEDPNVVKVAHEDHLALYFSRLPIPYQRDAPNDLSLPYHRHIGIYIFRREVLLELINLPESALEKSERLEQLRWLANGYQIGIAAVDEAGPGIDHPEDLVKAAAWLEQKNA